MLKAQSSNKVNQEPGEDLFLPHTQDRRNHCTPMIFYIALECTIFFSLHSFGCTSTVYTPLIFKFFYIAL